MRPRVPRPLLLALSGIARAGYRHLILSAAVLCSHFWTRFSFLETQKATDVDMIQQETLDI